MTVAHLDRLRPPDLLISQTCGEFCCTLEPGLSLLNVLGQCVLLVYTLLIAGLELCYLWGPCAHGGLGVDSGGL